MKYKIEISQRASRDISKIYSYLEKNASKSVGVKYLHDFKESISRLQLYPKMGKVAYDTYTNCFDGYRKLFVKSFVILYIVNMDKRSVQIMSIYHTKMDYLNNIGKL